MADKRAKLEQFVTPKGIAVWPHLQEPDTKWKAEGEYHVKIRLSADDSQPLIDRIEELISETMEAEKARLTELAKDPKEKKKAMERLKALKLSDKSYKEATDDDGNETGEYEFNIKMRAKYTNKKTGKVTKLTPKLFDSAKPPSPLPASVQIWGGSTIKVSGQYNPYVSPKGEVGVSLRMGAVQVIKLVSAGSGGNASSYGFEGEDDGFVAEGSEFNDDEDNTGTDEGGTGDENDEF